MHHSRLMLSNKGLYWGINSCFIVIHTAFLDNVQLATVTSEILKHSWTIWISRNRLCIPTINFWDVTLPVAYPGNILMKKKLGVKNRNYSQDPIIQTNETLLTTTLYTRTTRASSTHLILEKNRQGQNSDWINLDCWFKQEWLQEQGINNSCHSSCDLLRSEWETVQSIQVASVKMRWQTRWTIIEFFIHMHRTELNFSATVLTFG